MDKRIYEFDGFRLDFAQKRLRRGNETLMMPPKVFDVLLVFLERSGELLSRDELMEAVWADTFVEETNLRFCVHALRKTLGKNADGRDYIETVPKRGYRFTAEVGETSAESNPLQTAYLAHEIVPPHSVRKLKSVKRKWLAASSVLTIICLLLLVINWQRQTAPLPKNAFGINTLAVLPFTPVGVKETDFSQIGLTDVLITNLSKIKSLKVLPVSSVQKFAGQDFDALAIGRELKADAVFEGSYRYEDGYLRVNVRLISAKSGETIWTETLTADEANVLECENSISLRAAHLLSLRFKQAEDARAVAANQNLNAEAVQHYLAARRIWQSGELFRRVEMINLFEKTIALEPAWALAYSGYAEALLSDDQIFTEWEPPEQKARKAIALDGAVAAPHTVLGEIYQWRDWNWQSAEDEFKLAIELTPDYAPARHKYSQFLRIQRRYGEAEEEIKKAIEIDPLSPLLYASLCELYYFDQKTDRALDACLYSQQLEPNFWLTNKLLFRIYGEKKMYGELSKLVLGKLPPAERSKHPLSKAIAEKDLRLFWRDLLQQDLSREAKEAAPPIILAMEYIQLGEREKALDWLEKSLAERFEMFPQVNADPVFDSVRREKRFTDMMRKIGLQ